MKKLIILFFVFLTSCGVFVDKQEAVDILEKNGFTDVEVQASHFLFPKFWGCSKEDDVAFSCFAKNQQGRVVSVVVCSGFPFKKSTIRY